MAAPQNGCGSNGDNYSIHLRIKLISVLPVKPAHGNCKSNINEVGQLI